MFTRTSEIAKAMDRSPHLRLHSLPSLYLNVMSPIEEYPYACRPDRVQPRVWRSSRLHNRRTDRCVETRVRLNDQVRALALGKGTEDAILEDREVELERLERCQG